MCDCNNPLMVGTCPRCWKSGEHLVYTTVWVCKECAWKEELTNVE